MCDFVLFRRNSHILHLQEEKRYARYYRPYRDIIIIPDNFFKKIAKENEKLVKYGAESVKALDRIKHSYETAMADTDNRLLTQTNAKTTTRARKTADTTAAASVAPATVAAPADKK